MYRSLLYSDTMLYFQSHKVQKEARWTTSQADQEKKFQSVNPKTETITV